MSGSASLPLVAERAVTIQAPVRRVLMGLQNSQPYCLMGTKHDLKLPLPDQ
jgi:hypothetical protein